VDHSSTSTETGAAAAAAEWLERIDRRWLYVAMIMGVVGALLLGTGVTVKVTPPVSGYWDRIEALARTEGHLVVVAMDFDPQTQAENYPQAVATVRHLFARKIPFAVVTLVTTGAGFCEAIPRSLAAEYGAEYGTDWVNWGYKYGGSIFIKALSSDVAKAVERDAKGTPVADIPLMKGVTDATSVDMLCEFTGSVGVLEGWLQFFQKSGHRPVVLHGCTAVSGPSNYAFLDSEQISGLLVGMLGAAEYEQLLGVVGGGLRGMSAQTVAHLLIIAFIVIGNVAGLIRMRSSGAKPVGGTP
jgi:hypothetical protein